MPLEATDYSRTAASKKSRAQITNYCFQLGEGGKEKASGRATFYRAKMMVYFKWSFDKCYNPNKMKLSLEIGFKS